ncbi:diacylglycerol/lipid kinase family protein [Brevibacillus choshinensis]|uniref:Diacylglycerol kinase family lipid kinase n=1 Tax=Brevibacillus choshinensis TaxID=54911 RepID=A0ABX7FPR8_BRECH|nr:diacylglycerol kinase family protein [Brevibacillus choshinensis]QRG67679.1 diacylglycerol kinase family lipid kinase [Brevibacillus choshinensis]
MLGFIVNPVAGNGKGKEVWGVLEQILRQQEAVYRVRETSREGEAQTIAVELIEKEGVNKIVAVGGDGTIHEVVNGIHQSGKACMLGHVAAGSGNDFSRGHGLSNDPEEAIERILSEKREKVIDLLKINGRLAVNSVGAGFDGQVAKTTNAASYKKWLNRMRLGKAAYLWSVIRVLFTYQPCEVKLTVDGEVFFVEKAWLIAIANIPNYGGGMLICPRAVADDGMAEICVVNDVGRWGLLRAFPQIFTGAHVNHPKVSFFRGKKITVEAQRPLFVHADGEIVDSTPLRVEVIPKSQRICG